MLAVAMLALPMSAAYATKPITMTLSGTYYMVGGGSIKEIEAGESGNVLVKIRDLGCVWTGDITAGDLGTWPDPTIPPVLGGVYNGQWLVKAPGVGAFPGKFILEDVTIAGRSGDLTIGAWEENARIESASGELSSIRGKGTLIFVSMFEWDYEFVVHINPLKD